MKQCYMINYIAQGMYAMHVPSLIKRQAFIDALNIRNERKDRGQPYNDISVTKGTL